MYSYQALSDLGLRMHVVDADVKEVRKAEEDLV